MMAIQIRFTNAPVAWNRNQRTRRIAAMTSNACINSDSLMPSAVLRHLFDAAYWI